MEKVCRTCLEEGVPLSSLHINLDDKASGWEMLKFLLNEDLDSEEISGICSPCCELLTLAYSFKMQCLESEEAIRKYKLEKEREVIEQDPLDVDTEEVEEAIEDPSDEEGGEEELQQEPRGNENSFNCLNCNTGFPNIQTLLEHFRLKHQKSQKPRKREVRKVPSSEFEEQQQLEKVHRGGKEEKEIFCSKCNLTLPNIHSWVIHTKYHHRDKKERGEKEKTPKKQTPRVRRKKWIMCDICGKNYPERIFAQHQMDHQPKFLPCPVCEELFPSEKELKVHEITHRTKEKYPCHQCSRSFKKANKRRDHIAAVHTHTAKNECSTCGKTFAHRSNLSVHRMIHTGAFPHQCPVCPMKFRRKYVLTDHLTTHTGQKDFLCAVCSKAFGTKKGLGYHIKKMHLRERNYVCDVCNNAYGDIATLRNHLRHKHPHFPLPPKWSLMSKKPGAKLCNRPIVEDD